MSSIESTKKPNIVEPLNLIKRSNVRLAALYLSPLKITNHFFDITPNSEHGQNTL